MATTIRVDNAVTTLVNIFMVEPDNQSKVLAMLQDGIETLFSKMPGWISTSLHKSHDGRRIVVYSQWRDAKDIEAFRQDPTVLPYLQSFAAVAKSEAVTCDVAYSRHV